QDTLLVTVTNSAPVLGMLDDQTVLEDAELVISVTYSDSGSADTHTAQIDWGDGNVTEGVVDAVNGKVNGSHTYAAPGTYSLILTLHDDDDGTDSLTVEVVVSPASYLTSLPIVILGR
ncbi:MAG: PKD domain-containing protein, partial [Anaerolineales bacterium]|nr:PKD domain-containing protein [Anaerolineales bacterium]